MYNLIETIYLSEKKRSFSICDVKVIGNSLTEKAKNKYLVMNYLNSDKTLKVRGKEKQLEVYKKLEETGIRIEYPTLYKRDIILSRILGFLSLKEVSKFLNNFYP
jgi:hypothetical protein